MKLIKLIKLFLNRKICNFHNLLSQLNWVKKEKETGAYILEYEVYIREIYHLISIKIFLSCWYPDLV